MSAAISLTLDDEERTPFMVDIDRVVRYEPQCDGSIVTYLSEGGLVTCVVRESRRDIEALIRVAARPA